MAYTFKQRQEALIDAIGWEIQGWDDGYHDEVVDFLTTFERFVKEAGYSDMHYQDLMDWTRENREDIIHYTGGSDMYNEVFLLDTQTTF